MVDVGLTPKHTLVYECYQPINSYLLSVNYVPRDYSELRAGFRLWFQCAEARSLSVCLESWEAHWALKQHRTARFRRWATAWLRSTALEPDRCGANASSTTSLAVCLWASSVYIPSPQFPYLTMEEKIYFLRPLRASNEWMYVKCFVST